NQFQASKNAAYNQAQAGSYQTGVQAGATRTATQNMAMQAEIQRALAKSGWTTSQIQQLLGILGPNPTGPGAQSNLLGPSLQNSQLQQQLQAQLGNNLIGGTAMLLASASDVEAKEDFSDPAPAIEEFLQSAEPSEYSYKPEYHASPLAGE